MPEPQNAAKLAGKSDARSRTQNFNLPASTEPFDPLDPENPNAVNHTGNLDNPLTEVLKDPRSAKVAALEAQTRNPGVGVLGQIGPLLDRITELNRIETHTPFGSQTFSGDNRNVSNLTFSPEIQRQFDLQSKITEGTLEQALERQGKFGDIPKVPSSVDFSKISQLPTDLSAQGRELEKATFTRGSDLLNRQFDRNEERLRNRLANQGLPQGGEAFTDELGRFETTRNEAFQNLALDSVAAGRNEQSRLLNDTLRTRESQTGEQLTNINLGNQNRSREFNELQALLGNQQTSTPGTADFFAPGQTDVLGAAGLQQQSDLFNRRLASDEKSSKNSATSSLVGTLGGAIISSKELKDEVGDVTILDKLDKTPVKLWKYKGDKEVHIGPYAEDFKEHFGFGDGRSIPVIDYAGVLFAGTKELSDRVKLLERKNA